MSTHKPYNQRSDLEKILSQWKKQSGLCKRNDWSAAIVRAATAAEIAANFAIRKELRKLDSKFIDSLLLWANGLAGKLDKLLIPVSESNKKKNAIMKKLKKTVKELHSKRNAIIHRGEFAREKEAKKIIQHTQQFITMLVQIYIANFKLE